MYQKGPENWVCRIMDAIDENMRQVAIAADAKEAASSILTILKPYIPHLSILSLPIILTKNIMRTTFMVRAPTIERKKQACREQMSMGCPIHKRPTIKHQPPETRYPE